MVAHGSLLRELPLPFPARVGSWGADVALCVPQGDSEPRYKCHVCDKCFTRGNNLTVHLRKKHQFKWPSGHPRFRYCPPLSPQHLLSSAGHSWSCILHCAGNENLFKTLFPVSKHSVGSEQCWVPAPGQWCHHCCPWWDTSELGRGQVQVFPSREINLGTEASAAPSLGNSKEFPEPESWEGKRMDLKCSQSNRVVEGDGLER